MVLARSEARKVAMQLVYAQMLGGDGSSETMRGLLAANPTKEDAAYIEAIVQGIETDANTLDTELTKHLINWSIERLSRIDLAILRIAAYEILRMPDVPAAVSINEAIELSRVFSTDDAGSFINGVLASFVRAEESIP